MNTNDKFILDNFKDFERAISYLNKIRTVSYTDNALRGKISPYSSKNEAIHNICNMGFFRKTLKTPYGGYDRFSYWDDIEDNIFFDGLITLLEALYKTQFTGFNYEDILPTTKGINTKEFLSIVKPFKVDIDWIKEHDLYQKLYDAKIKADELKKIEAEKRLNESLDKEKFERLTRQYKKEADERAFYLDYAQRKNIDINKNIAQYLSRV